jgi:hypothetical protein
MGPVCGLGGRVEQQFIQRFLACLELLQRSCVACGQFIQRRLGMARFR